MAGRNLRGELMFYNLINLKGKEERRQVAFQINYFLSKSSVEIPY